MVIKYFGLSITGLIMKCSQWHTLHVNVMCHCCDVVTLKEHGWQDVEHCSIQCKAMVDAVWRSDHISEG